MKLRAEGRPLCIGHRGAPALAPENTLRSFSRAVEEGADLVELDVLQLVDGTLVVAHSDDLAEVSHGRASGRIGHRGLAELRELAPELATLAEALELFRAQARGTGLHVDLKTPGCEEALVEALREHGLVKRTLVASCHAASVRAVGRLDPGLALGLTYPCDRLRLSGRAPLAPAVPVALLALRAVLPYRVAGLLRRAGASAAVLNHAVVTRAAVERCHRAGAAVLAWTVDDADTMQRMLRAGVDGVITNDPRICAGTLSP